MDYHRCLAHQALNAVLSDDHNLTERIATAEQLAAIDLADLLFLD